MSKPIPLTILDTILDGLYLTIEIVCKLVLLTMVIIISYTVFGRFILNRTPTWGEELSIFCMVWLAVLGSALAVRNGIHIRMTIIDYLIPEGLKVWVHRGAYLVIMFVGFVFLFAGSALFELDKGSIIGALGISRKWLALALPVGGASQILMVIARFRRGGWA